MPFCSDCGYEMESSARFCRNCGTALATVRRGSKGGAGSARDTPDPPVPHLPDKSPFLVGNILWDLPVLLVLSHLETVSRSYPNPRFPSLACPDFVCSHLWPFPHSRPHALLQRVDAPSRSSKHHKCGVGCRAGAYLLVHRLGFLPSHRGFTSIEEISQKSAAVLLTLNIISITIIAGLLIQVQSNLNHYWGNLANVSLAKARTGVGEVIFAIIGLLLWLVIWATLLSDAFSTYGT